MRNYVTTYDPFFDLFFQPEKRNNHGYLMSTDIIDKKDHYEMKVNLPNVKKDDLKVSIDNGYLTIDVVVNNESEEKNEHDYILRERSYGSYQRRYYVGEDVEMKDISGKLENGLLTLQIKKPNEQEIKKSHYVQIE